jgi:pyruvate,water dikinase
MLNVASPGLAQFSHLPNKGVGLAREEFIINNYIGIHPLALMNHRSLDDMLSKEIEHKITGYPDEETFFIEKLASGVAKNCCFILSKYHCAFF